MSSQTPRQATVDLVRTPEERFASISDYPWTPQYAEVGSPGDDTCPGPLRMAYVDEGPRDAPVVLLLHGEPTWGYLYRHMIPVLLEAGLRVVVPDLVGFGRSDKPTDPAAYSYARHVAWTRALCDELDLADITLFCQDWGSLIGLRMVGEQPERFARVVVGNGFLPAGEQEPTTAFRVWRAFARWSPVLPISRIVAVGTHRTLSKAERAAYDAPFPTRRHLAGARAFPKLVPTDADDPAMPAQREAWAALGRYDRPFLCLFGKLDPILGRGDGPLIAHVPGAEGQPHDRLVGGHFVQEDVGPELARGIVDLVARTS
ncbi:haloalkane dehalogenase [uncultured Nocardioides sp.]|uniref:haloalkane dehalogenase n=1 Tax=uncultured Nocardioides sp. TaxID=198441 RepID=UPI002609C0C5|nr:haloalkane dehalogenase [uncultured Nocardioides sp.]